jgi:hypothetical protein
MSKRAKWEGMSGESVVEVIDRELRKLGSNTIPTLLQSINRQRLLPHRAFEFVVSHYSSLPAEAQRDLADFAFARLPAGRGCATIWSARDLDNQAWRSSAESLLLQAKDPRLLSHMLQSDYLKTDELIKCFPSA